MCLAISTPAVLPSVGRKTSAPRTCLTPLNTSPAPSPVNASRLSSRTARASLGAGAVRYSFTVTDFHRLPLAGLAGTPIHIISYAGAFESPTCGVVVHPERIGMVFQTYITLPWLTWEGNISFVARMQGFDLRTSPS